MPNKVKENIAKGINIVGNIANNITNMYNFYHPNFSERPIGLANKASRNWVEGVMKNLERNIGEYRMQSKERLTTPIGYLADPEYNQKEQEPWFMTDFERSRYYDYLDYMDNAYFDGQKKLINYKNPNGIRELDFDDLDPEKANPGVIRKIIDWRVPNPSLNSSDVWDTSIINPNNYYTRDKDTRMGALSNYYLIKTLESAQQYQRWLGFSSYIKPEDDTNVGKTEKDRNSNSSGSRITRGAYYEFGPNGRFGISGDSSVLGSTVTSNSEFIGDIIPWSTADTVYDTSLIKRDLDRVQDIQKLENQESIDYIFLDKAQNTTPSNQYYPFGNYYSMTYSLGLIAASGAKTQKYIANSMLGYPLSTTEKDYSGLLTSDSADTIILDAYKKYYVGNGTRGSNYIDKMTSATVRFIKFGGTQNRNIVRYDFPDAGNDNMWAASSVYQHREAEGNVLDAPGGINSGITNYNSGIEWGKYKLFDKDVIATKPDIINKTNELFMNNKIKTIIGRFHTDAVGTATDDRMDKGFIGSATSQYGASRGRNLLKKDHKNYKTNGYSDPYCRVWTYHHEYSTMKDLIRPFVDVDSLDGSEISHYRTMGVIKEKNDGTKESWDSGQNRLEKYGAKIKSNKLVRFAPTRDKNEEIKDQLKHLMFSIENLAWKDCTDELDEDQKGPLGGRIMWFPPYGLEFNENVTTQWNEVEFIGRGEKIPTYINTNRGGTLNFDILVDHPSVVNSFSGKGIGGNHIGDVDDTESYEQTLLRFFAGCEILNKTTDTYVVEQEPPKPNPPSPVTIEVPPVVKQDSFSFYVFYPNNYSGAEDTSDYFANYIVKGTGSGVITNGNDGDITNSGIGYEMKGTKIAPSTGLNGTYTTPKAYNNAKISAQDGLYWCSYFNPEKCDDRNIGRGIRNPKEWGYRIDSKYRCQILANGNYCDNKSYGMNSSLGYKDAIRTLTNEEPSENDFAFSEVYAALTDGNENAIKLESTFYTSSRVDKIKEKIDSLKEVLTSTTNKTAISVTVSGFASSHGHNILNEDLFKNRADTIGRWLKIVSPSVFGGIRVKIDKLGIPYKVSQENTDLYEAKASRAAKVTISFTTEELVSNVNSNINILDNEMEEKMQLEQERYNNTMLSDDEDAKIAIRQETIAQAVETPESMRTMTNVEWWDRFNDQCEWYKEAKKKDIPTKAWSKIKDESNKELGYRNEYKFFSELEKNDSFLHSKIVDKIKFFDPAFHSITPEGYQARLTFLHQCTRQGSTSAWTDSNSIRSAANLAFGRPPILVLRIGDFYNTKIVITSMNIDFKTSNGITWDLNDEGIGIMPMYAHISINFNFYGGSDLGGPISRLQNAVSFNYYANTGVYDKRSEMVEYNDDGTLARVKEVDIK